MPNRNQRAGSDWEEASARAARDAGFKDAERTRVKHPDRGDIGHVPAWTIECKSPGPAVTRTPEAAWSALKPAAAAGMSPADLFLQGFMAGQKATTRFDIAGAMDQLSAARAHTGDPFGVVLRKRPRAVPARGYAIMEMSQFWDIARRLACAGDASHRLAAVTAAAQADGRPA
jgi:hypothetical protein